MLRPRFVWNRSSELASRRVKDVATKKEKKDDQQTNLELFTRTRDAEVSSSATWA